MEELLDNELSAFLSNQELNTYDFTSLNSSYNENKSKDNEMCTGSSQTVDIPDPELLKTGSIPICDDLYISTTTKVLFLNYPIDIQGVFWNIPVIDYLKSSN